MVETLSDVSASTVLSLGLKQLSPEDRNVVARARRWECFLTQPFFTTGQFTGLKGKRISVAGAIARCERFLKDKFRVLFSMIGPIREAKRIAP